MPGGSPLPIIIPLSEAKKNNLNSRELPFTCKLKPVRVYTGMKGCGAEMCLSAFGILVTQ